MKESCATLPCKREDMVEACREVGRVPLPVEMDIGDTRLFPGEMVMDGCHIDSLSGELRQDGLQLGRGQHEIAHHHGVRRSSAKAGPRAQCE